MTWPDLLKAVVIGAPTLVVAAGGLLGILITQRRADAREVNRIESEARFESQRLRRGERTSAYLSFLASIRSVSRVAQEVLPPSEGGVGDLTPSELEPVDQSHAAVLLYGGTDVRAAGQLLVDGFITWVDERTDESWARLSQLEDDFLSVARSELGVDVDGEA